MPDHGTVPSAFAAESVVISQSSAPPEVCYPTSVSRSEDGTEIRKYYDLGPEEDPAGIPRSDFEQDGFHYTLIDLLKQELPENESRQHTETVSLESKSKDMESVLALLPQEKEFITEDGLSGVLTLQLDTVQVEVAGYGSSTREVSATRSLPQSGQPGYRQHPQDHRGQWPHPDPPEHQLADGQYRQY
ncbi:MAG: hypothetical protein V8Q30_03885 [Acutalibacteraceae bacterium]